MAGGSELGSAHVSIFPQMKGFRQNVAKQAGKAVSDLKNAFCYPRFIFHVFLLFHFHRPILIPVRYS